MMCSLAELYAAKRKENLSKQKGGKRERERENGNDNESENENENDKRPFFLKKVSRCE